MTNEKTTPQPEPEKVGGPITQPRAARQEQRMRDQMKPAPRWGNARRPS